MTEIQETATPLATLSSAYATVTDHLAVISEAATGYRRTLEGQGWSETVAESIARLRC